MGWGKCQAVFQISSMEQPSKFTISQAIGLGHVLQMDQQQPIFSWASLNLHDRWYRHTGMYFLDQKVVFFFKSSISLLAM